MNYLPFAGRPLRESFQGGGEGGQNLGRPAAYIVLLEGEIQ